MGFFTTERDDSGRLRFHASHKWWIFLVLSAGLTALTFVSLKATGMWAARQANAKATATARRESARDGEKLIRPRSKIERLYTETR